MPDYTGVDISAEASRYLHKPFAQASAAALPFADDEFDALWTIWVLEHVVDPEAALCEFRRVLKPGGVLLLWPAWQCRPWAAGGYATRPYREFGLRGKLIKASIPIRDSKWYRGLRVLPKRVLRLAAHVLHRHPVRFHYVELTPNYETFWAADSDAVNSMDPFEAILWFRSRGDACLTHRTLRASVFVRTGPIVFRIGRPSRRTPSTAPPRPVLLRRRGAAA